MCLNWTDSFRKKGNMKENLLEKIIDELIENKKYLTAPINICGIGSPLLYKNLDYVLDMFYSNDINTVITTNGILLNKENSLLLLEKCDKIMISLDAFSRDSYYKIKGVDYFNNILENIITLFYLKKTYGYYTQIQINMLNINSTFDDIINCLNYFGIFFEKGDNIYTRNVKDVGLLSKQKDTNDNLSLLKEKLINHAYFDKIVLENWKEWLDLKDDKRFACKHLKYYCMILYNGDVTVCCMDFNATLVIGNINDNSIKEIWNSQKYNRFRKEIKENNFKNKEICTFSED